MLQGASLKGVILPKAPTKAPAKGPAKVTFATLPKGTRSPLLEQPKLSTALRESGANAKFAEQPRPVKSQIAPGAQLRQLRAVSKAAAPKTRAAGGSALATIFNIPAQVEAKGYQNLAKATGAGVLNKVGSLAAEAVNLPTQTLPAAYQFGHALGKYEKGEGSELHELGKQYLKESAVAHVLKGDFKGAAEAAGRHPLGTALEATGAASAVDRALGSIGRLSGAEAANLAEPGATTISRSPKELVPGGASKAMRPYDKGLVRKIAERKLDEKPLSEAKVTSGLRQHYDRTESALLRISRSTRNDVQNARHAAIKASRTRKIAGVDAVVPHGQFLADPAVLDKHGEPLYRKQLTEMVQHLSQPRDGELPQEAHMREANRDYFQRLREDPHYHANPQQAYKATLKLAADKRALEPQLVKHGIYTKDQIRTAKVIPAFQFHFRNQNPFVDTTVPVGESPFKLNGRTVPVDAVYKKLEAKGVHEKQLSFVTTRPFENKNAAFRSGHTPGGARVAKGNLTGAAFSRGLFDPTYDAAVRQHLTDAGLIDRANGDFYKASQYVQGKEPIAKLIEKKIGSVPKDQQATLRNYVAELREGGTHFEAKGGKSPWQRALEARDVLKSLYPDSQLEPVRTVHPYATKTYTDSLGKRLQETTMDRLDPSKYKDDQHFWQSQFPTAFEAQHNPDAGPVGLVHSEIAQRMKDYEKDTGKGMILRMPISFWRRANVAFSVRHVPGVMQEIGGRALMNNIGLLSHLRGTKAYDEILHYGLNHPDSDVKLGAQRLREMGRGTVAAFTEDLSRHTTAQQFARTPLAKPADWWEKGTARKITGAPLRAVQGAMHSFSKVTNGILAVERHAIEHPPQIAGLGKHYNNEFKAITGKRLNLVKAFNDVEKSFLHGQLDPKALDHFANVGREYWGDWSRASPELKKFMAVSPFWQWYRNSLRFVYKTMPLHHPVKTGLFAAIEGATAEQRAAEGQGYKGGFPFGSDLLPTDLEPSQQGSIPGFSPGERIGQEFYTPQGAVSSGPLESAIGAVLPYASGAWSILHGINPLTNKPLEETIEGKKQTINDPNTLAMLGALSAAESFLPPIRYAEELGKKSPSYVFRPLRTEKTRTDRPTKKPPSLGLGTKLGTSLGTKLGTSLR